jgi:short-subunit dehydrogenase
MKSKNVVLITGCSSGFGYLSAMQLSNDQNVIATMRHIDSSKKEIQQLANQPNIDVQHCDVLDEQSIKKLIHYVDQTYSKIDVLINNAGVFLGGFFEDCESEEIDKVLNTNIKGVMTMTKHALPLLRESKKGKIINISSSSGLVAMPTASVYAASKFALEGWSEGLAYELAMFNISVSCVQPQTYQTDMLTKNLTLTKGRLNKNSPYFHAYPLIFKRVLEKKIGRHPSEVVAVIIKILKSNKPKLHYQVGPRTTLSSFLKKVIPCNGFHYLVKKTFLKIIKR